MFFYIVFIGTLLSTISGHATDSANWKLVWSDEFNQPNFSEPDPLKWNISNRAGTAGNNEQQYYTSRPQNIFIEDGDLVIQTEREDYLDSFYKKWDYTSARIDTKGLFEQTYGKFEARIKVAKGQGMWPAFWMLGNDIDLKQWPQCGEIDVMESVGKLPGKAFGTLHGPGYSGSYGINRSYELPSGENFADDYHVFAVEWQEDQVQFLIDDVLYFTVTKADIPANTAWVYDHPFYMVLNNAVGGYFPGYPDATTEFPQKTLVDYVRVYQRATIP